MGPIFIGLEGQDLLRQNGAKVADPKFNDHLLILRGFGRVRRACVIGIGQFSPEIGHPAPKSMGGRKGARGRTGV